MFIKNSMLFVDRGRCDGDAVAADLHLNCCVICSNVVRASDVALTRQQTTKPALFENNKQQTSRIIYNLAVYLVLNLW